MQGKKDEKAEKELRDLDKTIEGERRIRTFGNREEIEDSLISRSKTLISLELLQRTNARIIEIMEKNQLEPTYEEVADVWNRIRGGSNYLLKLNSGASRPILINKGQEFDISQLSGGERTALLVIIRTILCRKFTKMRLMLLDEPLQHLDSENRRLLIDFLLESFEEGWTDQLIVATFQESLVRKFHGNEKANIIVL